MNTTDPHLLLVGALLTLVLMRPSALQMLFHWSTMTVHSRQVGQVIWNRVRQAGNLVTDRLVRMAGARRGGGTSGRKPRAQTRIAKHVRHPPPDPKTAKLVIIPVLPGDIRIRRAVALLLLLGQRREERLGTDCEETT